MKFRFLAIIPAIALTTAACETVLVTDTYGGMNFYEGSFEYATQTGTIKTALVGSPFSPAASSEFAKDVIEKMKNAPLGRDVAFVPSPRNTDKKAFHIVTLFNGGHPISYASGVVDNLSGPADPRFRELVVRVARAMIPGYDVDHRSSGFTPF